jgi:hypothetical protein
VSAIAAASPAAAVGDVCRAHRGRTGQVAAVAQRQQLRKTSDARHGVLTITAAVARLPRAWRSGWRRSSAS